MIVVDTSALVAILQDEPLADECAAALEAASEISISAGTLAEALIVLNQRSLGADLENLIAGFGITVVNVDAAHARLCGAAYIRFGKRNHKAELNFGDCFAYALAKHLDCPLLFIGNDFAQTDIASALEHHSMVKHR